MKRLNRFMKATATLLAVLMAFTAGLGNVPALSAASAGKPGVDLLDPEFIASHGGNSVSLDADPNRSPYDVFGEAFGTDNPVEGVTKKVREILGEEAERHVANVYDDALGQNVWKVEVNGNDCYTCYLHGTTYDEATGKFVGGNDDRQRIEIRPGDDNEDVIGLENDITAYDWKLKIDKDIQKPSGFFHIFQYKAVNSYGPVGDKLPLHDEEGYPGFSSDEDGNPILTLTISSSATQMLEFRYAGIGSEAGQETLASIPLNDVKDRWVEMTVQILNSETGWVTMTMKDAKTGEILMAYDDPDRILDMWRRPEVKYAGKTFEGPYPAVSNMFNRPKWGIYRKADKSDESVADAKIYLADMTLYKSAVDVSPVDLAYGKPAYNVGAESGNAFQLANAKAERLTDGVQTDPVKYTSLTVPQDSYSALGNLSWIGTESSKKGNVVIDLGKVTTFNQLKLFAKSLRLKYVNVSVSDDTADHSGEDVESIAFTPVDPLYTDGDKEVTYFNANNSGGDDSADKEYLIDLGKTYSSRYVKLYVENGSGSNAAGSSGGKPTFTMTGPPRLTELEIYNAPETPKNLSVSYDGGTEATISWDTVPADYFVIYDNGKPLVLHADSSPYRLTNLDPGAAYKLTVRTAYTDPQSFKSMLSTESEAALLQTGGEPIVPNPPSSATAAAASEQSIDVSWEAAPGAQSYRVSLVTDAGERIVADDYEGTAYTIKDLSPGTAYAVKVYSIRRGVLSAAAAEGRTTTAGIRNGSDNLLYKKEVRYGRVWNDDTASYGAGKALDESDGSRWVALKGSATAWMMADIGETVPVSALEYYSYQNKLKKVSFYYATEEEAFADPASGKWTKLLTDDRVAQGKYGNPDITSIAERITLETPVNARFIKFTVDEVDGDINVNEVKAFGPMSFERGSALTAPVVEDTGVELSWAGSNTTLPAAGYEVYNGDAMLGTVTNDVYQYRVTDLTPDTLYTFRVKAVSETVSDSVYKTPGGLTLQVKTLPGEQGPGPDDPDDDPDDHGPRPGTSDPVTSDPSTDTKTARLDLRIDATVTRQTMADSRTASEVTVKGDRLKLAADGKEVVEIVVDSGEPAAIIELPGAALQGTASLTALRIIANGTTYTLPQSVLRSLQSEDGASIYIGTVAGERLQAIEAAIAGSEAELLLASPVEFRLEAGGRDVTDFEGIYVERKVTLDRPADPGQATAVWIDGNNALHFAPSVFSADGDGGVATILSTYNGIYTVIRNDKSFDDLKGHWSEATVRLLAGKGVMNGRTEHVFGPDDAVTRAEFAAMLVRSLGLREEAASSFSDVQANDWFAGAVGAAKAYGLIDGFEDGTFRPGDRITREQVAVMALRALLAAGKESADQPVQELAFADSSAIGEWSREAVGRLTAAKLLQGMPDGTFAPRSETTRAQAATLLERMLRHMGFINS